MKIRNILGLTLIFSISSAMAQEDYGAQISKELDDVLMRVTSKNGLNLRLQPSATAKLLIIIPFGTSVWVRSGSRYSANIDGKNGHWVRVDYSNFKGWAFDGYLDSRELQVKPGFKDFRGGCTGIGCYACGAMVFDPDGYFIHSDNCHKPSPKLGRWQIERGSLRTCIGLECNPSSAKSVYRIFTIHKTGQMYIQETGEKRLFDDPWLKWESGGWPDAPGRNRNLVPQD